MQPKYTLIDPGITEELDRLLKEAKDHPPMRPKFKHRLQKAIGTIGVADDYGNFEQTHSVGILWLANRWAKESEQRETLEKVLGSPFSLLEATLPTNEYVGPVVFRSDLSTAMELEQREALFLLQIKNWGPPTAPELWVQAAHTAGISQVAIIDMLLFLLESASLPLRVARRTMVRLFTASCEPGSGNIVGLFPELTDQQVARAFRACVAFDPCVIMMPTGPFTFLTRVEERLGTQEVAKILDSVFRNARRNIPSIGEGFVPEVLNDRTYDKMFKQLIDTTVKYECMPLFEHFVHRLSEHRHFINTYRRRINQFLRKYDSSLPIVRCISNRLRKSLRNMGWHVCTTVTSSPELGIKTMHVVERSSSGAATVYIASVDSGQPHTEDRQVMFDVGSARYIASNVYEVCMEQLLS